MRPHHIPSLTPPSDGSLPQKTLESQASLIATGWLITNIALSIADLPLRFLLKDQLGLNAVRISMFFLIGNFTNYIKPVAGVLTDALPFMGTRRRNYILLGVGSGAFFWLALGLVHRSYADLLIVYTLFYVTVVITSTSLGGRMIEIGREYGAYGRLTAQRIGTFRVASVAGGLMGGWLAGNAFGITIGIASCPHILLFALYFRHMTEPKGSKISREPVAESLRIVRLLISSRVTLAAGGMIFLIAASPGFGTALLFYQTNTLHFTKVFVGGLSSINAAFGLLGAWINYVLCRRRPVKVLLVGSVIAHAIGTLSFLHYTAALPAVIITAIAGISGTLAILPVYDLAARGTPAGAEAIGYAVMMSVWNATNALSDWTGSTLFDRLHFTFRHLVWVNAATTALVLFVIPLLPAVLLHAKDNDVHTGSS